MENERQAHLSGVTRMELCCAQTSAMRDSKQLVPAPVSLLAFHVFLRFEHFLTHN